jgi:serine-type D-Ala-D-Ala endopeptidase (penicillin-binding protein 7)
LPNSLALVQWIVHRASTSRIWVRFLYAGPLTLALALPVVAKTKPVAPPAFNARAVLLFDYKTNKVIEAHNIHERMPIASVSKLMTAYVILESNLDLDEKVTVPATVIEKSRVLKTKLVITRQELLHLALISSDNVAAKTLAETYPAGADRFVAKMNETAVKLGMTNTGFIDPSGLSVFNTSTAWDLHLLNRALIKYSIFNDTAMSKTSVQTLQTSRGHWYKVMVRNTSIFAGDYDLRIGKTGFTNAAKWCINMQIRLSGHSFDIIVLGSPTKHVRNNLVKSLIDKNLSRVVSIGAMYDIEQLDPSSAR